MRFAGTGSGNAARLAGCEPAGQADPNLCLPHVLKEQNDQIRSLLAALFKAP